MGIFGRNKAKQQDRTEKAGISDQNTFPSNSDDSSGAPLGTELIAVITAAVQAFMGIDRQSKLIVRSFRRISSVDSVWNITSRYEQLNGKI